MIVEPGTPRVETYLSGLMAFVWELAQDHRSGALRSWDALAERVHAYFTPERMDQVEAVVPGWREMSSYGDGVTLVHVMCTYMGLLTSPEYERAPPAQRDLIKWIVLLHDLAKWVRTRGRDSTHSFRSAARAGAILPRVGFQVTAEYDRLYDGWSTLVSRAAIPEGATTHYVQDNRKLPAIVEGIERIFGRDAPAALIVKAILLHASITVLHEWPQAAPLTEVEVGRYLNRALLPLLKMMMLADNDGWELFNADTREAYRRETLAVFDRIELIVE